MIVTEEFDFARRLKQVRASRGLTQREVGERINVTGNLVSNWEMGNHGMPRLGLFRELCIALNCPPGDLLGLSPSGLSAEEYNLLKGFRQLNAAGRYTVMSSLDAQLQINTADPMAED